MTTIASSPSALRQIGVARFASPFGWRAMLAAVTIVGAGGAIAIGALPREPAGFEAHLALLLRFMAGLKALTALGVVALLNWRFNAPIAAGPAVGYLAALALMAIAPGLIWSLTHVAIGAVCFHAGLFGFLGLSLRDDWVGHRLLSRRR